MTRLPARRNPAAVRSKEEERTNTLTSQDQTLGSRQLAPLSGGLASGKAHTGHIADRHAVLEVARNRGRERAQRGGVDPAHLDPESIEVRLYRVGMHVGRMGENDDGRCHSSSWRICSVRTLGCTPISTGFGVYRYHRPSSPRNAWNWPSVYSTYQ